MSDLITVTLDGRELQVPGGTSVAAALLNAGVPALRVALGGAPRGAVCGMGSCFECRMRIDGVTVRSCLEPVRAGMRIELERGT